jgi:hypothetical protein
MAAAKATLLQRTELYFAPAWAAVCDAVDFPVFLPLWHALSEAVAHIGGKIFSAGCSVNPMR